MKIKALNDFVIAGMPSFSKDEERFVSDGVGQELIDRGIAERVEEKPRTKKKV